MELKTLKLWPSYIYHNTTSGSSSNFQIGSRVKKLVYDLSMVVRSWQEKHFLKRRVFRVTHFCNELLTSWFRANNRGAFSSYKPVLTPLPLLLASFMTKILSMRKSEEKVKMPFVNVQHSSIFRKILNKITMYSHCIYHRLDKRKIYTLTSLNSWLISSLFILPLFLSSIQVAQKRTSHKQKKSRKYLVFSNITFVKTRGSKTPTDVGSTLL